MRKEKLITICAFLMIVLSIFPIYDVYGQTFSVEPVAHLKAGDFGFNCPIDISNDGSTLAVAMKDESSDIDVTIINMSRFKILGSLEIDVSFNYLGGMSLSLNPNGTKLAVAAPNYLRIFTVPDLELEIAIDKNSSLQISFLNMSCSNIWPEDVAWSQNGEFLAVGLNEIGMDKPTVTIYDTNNWTRIVELSCNSHKVLALDYSHDGKMLACAGDGTVNGIEVLDVWNTSDWTQITTQSLNGLRVNDLAFNPIGTQLAAGGYGDLIQLWNTNDWSNQSFGGEYSDVTSTVSFSRDGELLLTDYVFWTVDDLNRWGEFKLATHGLFSPSHDEVVTVTFDGDLYKWDSSGWSAAAARGDKPNFKEPKPTITFTLCITLIVIAIAVLIIMVILAIITVLVIKKKSKGENTF